MAAEIIRQAAATIIFGIMSGFIDMNQEESKKR